MTQKDKRDDSNTENKPMLIGLTKELFSGLHMIEIRGKDHTYFGIGAHGFPLSSCDVPKADYGI
jgi:hypothetical protein